MATNNQANSPTECECKDFADQVKQDIDNLKEYVLMEIEENPLLGRKIAELIFMSLDEHISRPIEEMIRLCRTDGIGSVLECDSDMGCEANTHHNLI